MTNYPLIDYPSIQFHNKKHPEFKNIESKSPIKVVPMVIFAQTQPMGKMGSMNQSFGSCGGKYKVSMRDNMNL